MSTLDLVAGAAPPPNDPQREDLHNEVHARPPALVRLPALIVYIAVLNDGVTRTDEWAHLRQLPGIELAPPADSHANFHRLRLTGLDLTWERHSEFTRYSLTCALPVGIGPGRLESALTGLLPPPVVEWLRTVPGRTVAAIQLALVAGAIDDAEAALEQARAWFGGRALVGSVMGRGHSIAVTDFKLLPDGFERMLVIAPPGTTDTRAGRIAGRLFEIETYRLMALRGLPVAKALAPVLRDAERELAEITARLAGKHDADQSLLDTLVALAARVERITTEHMYRFSATTAYDAIVRQRLDELRELSVPGTPRIGEFMQRRLSPAIATVAATERRLGALSKRIERASALLRTRVDIAAEAQNQQLLEKLTRGQALQLRLQGTVEGLSIAAISYYMVSLILYAAKAANAVGWPMQPELVAGTSIPVVVLGVAWLTRRIHRRLQH